MRISYNAPFVLTFTFIATVIMFFGDLTGGITTQAYFMVFPQMSFWDPLTYVRLISHAAGHAGWGHLISNITLILLLGPTLEEKYGSKNIFFMAILTALITGLLNNFLFSTGLMGASGIVFMLILLSSFANFRTGTIPLTFVLIMVFFLGGEVIQAFENNNISEFAHIVGGICGSIFGFSQRNNN